MKAITAVRPGDGFEHWHHVTCRQFSVTECSRVVERDFCARIAARKFGDLWLYDYLSSTAPDDLIHVTRRAADIRRDQRDNFQLWIMLDGQTTLAQQDRTAPMRAGDLVIQAQSRPFDLELGPLAQATFIAIPRPLLSSRMSTTNGLAARKIAGNSKLGALVGGIVRRLPQLDEATDDRTEGCLSASTLDILAAVLEAEGDAHVADRRRERQLQEIKRYMLANLHDSALDIDAIAKARNVTPRTLYRLFAREGSTPIRWLWQQRLAASHKALRDGTVTQVTDAALDFGFKDLSHFSRAFKAAFGRSPRSLIRRRARP